MEEVEEITQNNNQPEIPPSKPKNVFTNKNFVLAFLGAFVSNTGNIFASFAISFYILALTNNNAFIQGVYLATGGITYTVVALFGGVISDRFHKGKIMYICDYIKAALFVAIAIMIMTVPDNTSKVVALFILTVIGNFIGAIFSPAASSLLPHIVPQESYQQAQSYYSAMNNFQAILGIVLAGIMYSLLSIEVLFIIVGACYLISGFSEMFIKYNHIKKEDKLSFKVAFQDIGSAFKYLGTFKPMLYLVIAVLFINFFFTPIASNILPYFVATDVTNSAYLFHENMAPEMWSAIISVALSLGSIIYAIILSMRKQKKRIAKVLRIAFILISLVLLLTSILYIIYTYNIIDINTLLISMVIIFFVTGGLVVMINVPISTTIISTVETDKLGKVNSLIDVGTQGLIPLSHFLAGIVISGFGISALLIGCTAGFVLITIFIMVNKHIGQL